MPLNTANVSFDATFDNTKSSLDAIVPMGQDLLCLKRETDKLVPIEPAVISEKAELLVRSHTFRSKRFRDIAIFSENVVGVTPKACPIIENRRKPCKFKCFNISDYPEVTPVPVLIGKDIITGEHFRQTFLYIIETKALVGVHQKVIVDLIRDIRATRIRCHPNAPKGLRPFIEGGYLKGGTRRLRGASDRYCP